MSKHYFVPKKYSGLMKAPYFFRDDAESLTKAPSICADVAKSILVMNDDLREACERADALADECQGMRTELHVMHNRAWRSALSITWRKWRGKP